MLIARRERNRRFYDLPKRVLPASVLAQGQPVEADTARWLVVLKLRQRRLVALKRDEQPLVEDIVQPVTVADCPPLFCLREDASLFDQISTPDAQPAADAPPPLLLAPLDPLIYDRRITQRLWGFDYAWEAYTPAAKRQRGYYALPVLAGTQFVGSVDLKADRPTRRLRVVRRAVRRGHHVAAAFDHLAAFLSLGR